MISARLIRPGVARSALVVCLLSLTVAVTAALTWEAVASARRARATAEGVLRDYATVTAVQFVREVEARLDARLSAGLDGVHHVLGGHHVREPPAAVESCDCRPPPGATAFSIPRLGPPAASGVLPLDPSIVETLRRDLDQPVNTRRLMAARMMIDRDVVVSRVHHDPRGPVVIGFAAPLTYLSGIFTEVIEQAKLLPGTLAGSAGHRRAIGLRVRDASGREVFSSGPAGAPYVGVAGLSPRFAGLEVEAAIPGDLAPALIIGGLPSERWPFAVGLLVLAVGLVVAAALQWRRELQFARGRADFVSSVSHELRTPLTQIRLFGETLLLERVRSAEERQRAAAVIVQEARRLGQMVDNILLFSRTGRKALAVQRDVVDAAALAADIVDGFRQQAAARSMTVALAAADGAGPVSIDPNVLRQILLNLLDNAVKYGPRGQAIRVGLSAAGGVLTMTVEDDGPGIPPSDRDRIWDPFWRATGSSEGGTGLGLAIVRELAHAHGGTATVESASGRAGARFVVTLDATPVSAPGTSPAQPMPHTPAV